MHAGAGESGTGAIASQEKMIEVSLLCDVVLWIAEIAAVILSGSVTLFADVMKNGNEILATVFALLIILKMKKGGAFTYDYGMGKFETFTRIATGAVMFISLIILFFTAFHRLFVPEEIEPMGAYLAIPVLIAASLVDAHHWHEYHGISRSDPSPIMETQWRLRRAKTVADIAVLLSLGFSLLLAGYAWAVYIDPVVSFIIIGFLLIAGIREISSSLPDLFDKTLEEELQILILRELSAFFHEYHEFYGIRSRRSGSKIYIDIFLGFDPGLTMGAVQDTCDRLKASMEAKISGSIVAIVPTSERSSPRTH